MSNNTVIEVTGPSVKLKSNKSKIVIHYQDDFNALIHYEFIVRKLNEKKNNNKEDERWDFTFSVFYLALRNKIGLVFNEKWYTKY